MALLTAQLGAWAVMWLMGAGGTEAASSSELKQRAEKLASEARALANPRGCEKVDECEMAGFGHKPCGGPREYIAWCSKTTDVKTLKARLDALEKAEKAWQEAAGLKSNCGLTRKPRLRWDEGLCRAR